MKLRSFTCCTVFFSLALLCVLSGCDARVVNNDRTLLAKERSIDDDDDAPPAAYRQSQPIDSSGEESDEDSDEDEAEQAQQNIFQQQQQQAEEESLEDGDHSSEDAQYDDGENVRRRRRRDLTVNNNKNNIEQQKQQSPAEPIAVIAEETTTTTTATITNEKNDDTESGSQSIQVATDTTDSTDTDGTGAVQPVRKPSVLILIRDALKRVTTEIPTEQVATNALQYFQLFEHFIQQTIEQVIGDDDDDEVEPPVTVAGQKEPSEEVIEGQEIATTVSPAVQPAEGDKEAMHHEIGKPPIVEKENATVMTAMTEAVEPNVKQEISTTSKM